MKTDNMRPPRCDNDVFSPKFISSLDPYFADHHSEEYRFPGTGKPNLFEIGMIYDNKETKKR